MCVYAYICIKIHSIVYALLYNYVYACVTVFDHKCKCRYRRTSVDIKFLGPRFIGICELHYMSSKSKMGVL